jgi:peptide deformylase
MTPAVETIRKYGDPCLRRRAEPADPAAADTAALRETMWAAMNADGGVGLAAPQIGCNRRVIVVRDPGQPAGRQRMDLVNPVITRTFGPLVPFREGCLSFPGLYTTVRRPQGVVVEHDGSYGRVRIEDDGLAARIIQHEIDHLDGVLFIDYLSWGKRSLLWPRLGLIAVSGFMDRAFAGKRDRV